VKERETKNEADEDEDNFEFIERLKKKYIGE
jgi:hypothetical protein